MDSHHSCGAQFHADVIAHALVQDRMAVFFEYGMHFFIQTCDIRKQRRIVSVPSEIRMDFFKVFRTNDQNIRNQTAAVGQMRISAVYLVPDSFFNLGEGRDVPIFPDAAAKELDLFALRLAALIPQRIVIVFIAPEIHPAGRSSRFAP